MKDLLCWLLIVKWGRHIRGLSMRRMRQLGALVATAHYLANRRARRAIRAGFQQDFGRRMPEHMIWNSIYHHQMNDLEMIGYPHLDADAVQRQISFEGEGWAWLQQNRRQAAVLFTVHFGPNQLLIPALPLLGFPLVQVAVPPSFWDQLVPVSEKIQDVNRARTNFLEKTGTRFLYVSDGLPIMRKAYRALRQGQPVCLAGDGRAGFTTRVPFLKGHLDVAPGGADLAERCRCPLIPVFCIRTDHGFRIWMPSALPVTPGNRAEQLRRWVQWLEQVVRDHPGQYGWIYYAKAVGG